ncbi:MAG: CHAT domain-containing protein, partial [Bacteroidales bacterium]
MNEVLELKKIYQPDNLLNIANTLTNIGIMNKRTFRTDRALEYYDQAEIIYKSVGNQPGHLASLYYNKGSLYFINKDYYKCERYLNEVRSILDTIKIPNFVPESVIYSLLGSVNLQKNNFNKALENFKIAEDIAKTDKEVLLNVYDNIIYAYLGLDIFDDEIASIVDVFLRKMKAVLDIEQNLPKKIDYYLFLGKYHYKKDPENNLTFSFYKNALEILNENYDSKHPMYNNVYRFIIDYFFERGNYLMTLEYVQKAFENLSSNFKSDNFYNNPDPSTFSDYSPVFYHLRYKTLALMHLYQDMNDLNYLHYAKENAEYTLSMLEELKWKYDHENHKYYISEAETEIFKISESINFELYKQTGEKDYLSRCFELNERGKAFSLLINIRSEQAMQFGGIPPELIKQESDIIEKLSAFTELIMTEKASPSPSEKKMRTWENSIFVLNNEHGKLIKFFEKNYPEYYRLKYDTRVISPDQVARKLQADEIIVEYSLTDSTLFTYLITKKDFNVIEQRIDTTFRHLCLNYYSTLTNQSFSYGVKKTFENYTRDAYKLYQILVHPIENYIEDKNVILIPDGEISYVSFEALLSEPVDPKDADYYRLPYLVLDHGFSNSFSATVHYMDAVKKNKPKRGILAYAPSYTNISAQNIGMELLRQSDMDQLIRIPGVKEEVNRISNFMHADVFQDYNATESSFKARAPDYKILHLAMHTI